MNKVLTIAVHPDDETLGCGGTLLKHKSRGDEIYWLIITEAKKEDGFTSGTIQKREAEIKKVAQLFDFDKVVNLKLAAMRVDEYSMSFLIEKISNVIKDIKPNIIYLPFKSDVHSDHRKIFEAAFSCTKTFRYPYIRKIYMMETLSETEFSPSIGENNFIPNVFIDISDFFEKKLEIMKIYKSEVGEHPFPRSIKNIESLATFRGATAGCIYAESFVLLKEVN